jgi:nucleotide-binding universal stress UspA family protein
VGAIVAGVDGSDPSVDALRWAVEEGRLRHAKVIAVHAWEPPIIPFDLTISPPPDYARLVADSQAAAVELVAAAVETATDGAPDAGVETQAVEGPAATVLLEAARDAELLAVGSRGHGGFLGLLLGSVSDQCVRHAPCPVVVHRQPSQR